MSLKCLIGSETLNDENIIIVGRKIAWSPSDFQNQFCPILSLIEAIINNSLETKLMNMWLSIGEIEKAHEKKEKFIYSQKYFYTYTISRYFIRKKNLACIVQMTCHALTLSRL